MRGAERREGGRTKRRSDLKAVLGVKRLQLLQHSIPTITGVDGVLLGESEGLLWY